MPPRCPAAWRRNASNSTIQNCRIGYRRLNTFLRLAARKRRPGASGTAACGQFRAGLVIRFLFSGSVWRGAPMILALLAASVFGLALLMQHLYENDPGFRA